MLERNIEHEKPRLECLKIAAYLDLPPSEVLKFEADLFYFVLTGQTERAICRGAPDGP